MKNNLNRSPIGPHLPKGGWRLLVVVLAVSWSAGSVAQGAVTLDVQDAFGPADATVFVTVSINSTGGPATVFFRLNINPAQLALTHVLPGSVAIAAGKEVSMGMDQQGRPTVLITDLGGATFPIPNGSLVTLVMRTAASATIGQEFTVGIAEPSASTGNGSPLTVSAFAGELTIVACTPPSAPAFIAASDGTLSDRVAVGWLPSERASSYQVLRNTTNNFSGAMVVATVSTTQWDDFDAEAAMAGSGGCSAQSADYARYYYWVRGVNACGQSSVSPADPGYRGLSMASLMSSDGIRTASLPPLLGFVVIAGVVIATRCRA